MEPGLIPRANISSLSMCTSPKEIMSQKEKKKQLNKQKGINHSVIYINQTVAKY